MPRLPKQASQLAATILAPAEPLQAPKIMARQTGPGQVQRTKVAGRVPPCAVGRVDGKTVTGNESLVAKGNIPAQPQVPFSEPVALHPSPFQSSLRFVQKPIPEPTVSLELGAEPEAMQLTVFAQPCHGSSPAIRRRMLEHVDSQLTTKLPLRPSLHSIPTDGLHPEITIKLHEQPGQHVPRLRNVAWLHGEMQLPIRCPMVLLILSNPIHTPALRAQAEEPTGVEELILCCPVPSLEAAPDDLGGLLYEGPPEGVRGRLCGKLHGARG
mmetsp:Transcript_42248/g.111328  ORF Transcript_42248/g.111328 Transcript_42248/m.111328 type:complete len:269 (+) Transcript_42248:262-1068(+)